MLSSSASGWRATPPRISKRLWLAGFEVRALGYQPKPRGVSAENEQFIQHATMVKEAQGSTDVVGGAWCGFGAIPREL